jgi:hypothetical protein
VVVKCCFSYLLQLAEDIHPVRASHDSEHSTPVPAFDEVQHRSALYLHHIAHRRTQATTSVLLQADGEGLGGYHKFSYYYKHVGPSPSFGEILYQVDLFWDFDILSNTKCKTKKRSWDLDPFLGPFLGDLGICNGYGMSAHGFTHV